MLAFECSEQEMLERLLRRAETSGRVDDNRESILKRFATFRLQTIPVFEWYEALGKLRRVNCSGSVDDVYERTRSALQDLLHQK